MQSLRIPLALLAVVLAVSAAATPCGEHHHELASAPPSASASGTTETPSDDAGRRATGPAPTTHRLTSQTPMHGLGRRPGWRQEVACGSALLLVALVLMFGVGGRSVRDMGRGCVSVEAGNVLGMLERGGGRRVGFSSVKKSVGGDAGCGWSGTRCPTGGSGGGTERDVEGGGGSGVHGEQVL